MSEGDVPDQLRFTSSDVLFLEAMAVAKRRERVAFARGLVRERAVSQVQAVDQVRALESRLDPQSPQLPALDHCRAEAERLLLEQAPDVLNAIERTDELLLRAEALTQAFRCVLEGGSAGPLEPETLEEIDRDLENRHRRLMVGGLELLNQPAKAQLDDVQLESVHVDALAGLALSGGGIRSASYALGALESMSRKRLLSGFDVVSSVSGGGYAASWLTAWAYRHQHGVHGVENDMQPTSAQTSGPLRWVRRHCAYLAPRLGSPMSSDVWSLIVAYLWNWLPVLLLISSALLSLLLLPHGLVTTSEWLAQAQRQGDTSLRNGTALLAALLFVVLGGLLRRVTLYRRVPGRLHRYPLGLLEFLFYASLVSTVTWSVAHPLLSPLVLAGGNWLPGFLAGDGSASPVAVTGVVTVLVVACYLVAYLLTRRQVLAALDAIRNFRRARPLPAGALLWTGMPLLRLSFGAAVNVASVTVLLTLAASWIQQEQPATALVIAFGPLLLVLGLAIAELAGQLALHSVQQDRDRAWAARVGGLLLSGAAAWALLCLLALGVRNIDDGLSQVEGIALVGAAVGVAGLLTWRRFGLAGVAGLLVIIGFLWLVVRMALRPLLGWIGSGSPMATWGALGVVLLLTAGLAAIANVNRFSLHALYKEGLVRTFLGASRMAARNQNIGDGTAPPAGQAGQFTPRRQDPVTNIDLDDDPMLCWLRSQPKREVPLLLLNAAVNGRSLTDIEGRVPRQFPFTFSTLFTGSPAAGVGYARTEAFRNARSQPTLSLGTAMAVSGAAMSPTSGRSTHPVRALILGILNARLGVWIGNPDHPDAVAAERPHLAGLTVLREMLGVRSKFGRWIHLSDGGHFENLGIYELVRRGCRRVVAVDASCDPDRSFDDLAEAIRRIRIDLNIRIVRKGSWDIAGAETAAAPAKVAAAAWSDIGLQTTKTDAPPAALRAWMWFEIDYGPGLPRGRMLYVKPSVYSGQSMAVEVRNYCRLSPSFPHESTADQFFAEAQMEAYRSLGNANMDDALDTALQTVRPGQQAGIDNDPLGLYALIDREALRVTRPAIDKPPAAAPV